jgi:hypothetical protein
MNCQPKLVHANRQSNTICRDNNYTVQAVVVSVYKTSAEAEMAADRAKHIRQPAFMGKVVAVHGSTGR